eukprot:CAMPEP_0180441868 /NCGR_PEP_ID=MMETSP1036_2-20121128/13848_1 /TAXON_ID=632150 /ORGANISM="Azadinium spinosum, Strain 3D9" /LENGTH=43 /DNA_ID= /DNA_START= /DNA_END= /DNA_ORIENTATION=
MKSANRRAHRAMEGAVPNYNDHKGGFLKRAANTALGASAVCLV